ncbi:MAG: SAM-dependent methyltransferase [Syntrophaceae bacterium]
MSGLQQSDTNKESVEYTPSKTAMGAATLRAISAIDEREEYRGTDYLAEIFLTEERKNILKDPAARKWVIHNKIIPGMYEFIIARTAFFDDMVEHALRGNIPQIVFLGAGYDSRSYRFRDLIGNTRIFELDSKPTQQHKQELLRSGRIPIPEQIIYVPIDFNTDDVGDVLTKAGFMNELKALFVWEGVTYYLSSSVIDDTLNTIKKNSPAGSDVCFDYASHSSETLHNEDVKKLRGMMRSQYPGEPTLFGIQEGEIGSFLLERGYAIEKLVKPAAMGKTSRALQEDSPVMNVLGLFRFVHAVVLD